MRKIAMLIVLLSLTACQGQVKQKEVTSETVNTEQQELENSKYKINKTDEEWRAELTPMQYHVLRNKGTERPHTGEYDKFFEEGVYVCAACNQPLFKSDAKFDSHCGWPSFDQAIEGSVIYEHDSSHGMSRTEVLCANCGGHLGHVFDDGPKETTGDRFCTNSVSIKFIPAKK